MKFHSEGHNLVASISQTPKAINDRKPTGPNCVWFVLIFALSVFFVATTEVSGSFFGRLQDQDLLVTYLKTSQLMLRASEWRFEQAQELHPVVISKIGRIPLRGFALWRTLNTALQQVSALGQLKRYGGLEVLTALVEYYKILFVVNCLRDAHKISLDKGKQFHVVADQFLLLFVDEGEKKDFFEIDQSMITQQTQFVKACMRIVVAAEARSSFKKQRNRDFKQFFGSLQAVLPPCGESLHHIATECSRCCGLRIFEMVKMGCVEKNMWFHGHLLSTPVTVLGVIGLFSGVWAVTRLMNKTKKQKFFGSRYRKKAK